MKIVATKFDRRSAFDERGYSLMETVVSLFALTLVILGTATLLDSSNRLTVNALNRSEMQQTIRVAQRDLVRKIRMLGRGGLPAVQTANPPAGGLALPTGLAVSLINNFNGDVGEAVVPSDVVESAAPKTDVLILRGVFHTPVYLVGDSPQARRFTYDPTTGKGLVVVPEYTPRGKIRQDFSALAEAVGDPSSNIPSRMIREPLLLTSAYDERRFAVVELDLGPSKIAVDEDGSRIAQIAFRTSGGNHAATYAGLSANGPSSIDDISVVGTLSILEEYVYYVRDASFADPTRPPSYRLSRARTFPATGLPYAGAASNLKIDLADGVLDLQVAFGVDVDEDGIVEEAETGLVDEWLYNGIGDDGPTDAPFTEDLAASPSIPLRYLRISTLVRSKTRAPNHLASIIARIEDRDYAEDPLNDPFDDPILYEGHRRFQRSVLRTVVELRNL